MSDGKWNKFSGFCFELYFSLLDFLKANLQVCFFVSCTGNASIILYFDLKISTVLSEFIKYFLGFYIQNTTIFNSIKFTLSQIFLLSKGFRNMFFQWLRTFKFIKNKWLNNDNVTVIKNDFKGIQSSQKRLKLIF